MIMNQLIPQGYPLFMVEVHTQDPLADPVVRHTGTATPVIGWEQFDEDGVLNPVLAGMAGFMSDSADTYTLRSQDWIDTVAGFGVTPEDATSRAHSVFGEQLPMFIERELRRCSKEADEEQRRIDAKAFDDRRRAAMEAAGYPDDAAFEAVVKVAGIDVSNWPRTDDGSLSMTVDVLTEVRDYAQGNGYTEAVAIFETVMGIRKAAS